ncbi:MAG TPA: WGR domain-containing protein [Acetobacteraceae bacterium]
MLRRRDPTKRMARFYSVAVQAALFDGCNPSLAAQPFDLVREWGRIGCTGTLRIDSFASEAEACAAGDRAMRRKMRRGYR